MNNPTCPQCDCVAGCQANPALCPNLSAIAQPVQPAIDTQGDAWAALEELKACAQSGTGIVNPVAYNTLRRFISSANFAQPVQLTVDLERYLTANYPNAEGDTLTKRVISALEAMDIALGMKEIAQPEQPVLSMSMFASKKECDEAILAQKHTTLPGCHCASCVPQGGLFGLENSRMILCAICGNKRCPHATSHRNTCSNSNEPGQKGSSYGAFNSPTAQPKDKP